MANTYYLKISGFPETHTPDKIESVLKNCADSVIDISVAYDKKYLVALTFTGTPKKCVEEICQMNFSGQPLKAQLIKPYPILKNLPPPPMLYEEGSTSFTYFPEKNVNKVSDRSRIENDKYNRYKEQAKLQANNAPTDNDQFRMSHVDDPKVSPWSNSK